MKHHLIATTAFLLVVGLHADEAPAKKDTAEVIQKHQQGSDQAADNQDSLAADVQQLKIEQTQGQVIKLLDEVEVLMDEASGNLGEYNTGGDTISAQTEVIEKIFEAAKKKQCNGNCQSAQGMMEMMKRMMGEGAAADEKKPGKKPGSKPGEGMTGESDTANSAIAGNTTGDKAAERRVPKASGQATAAFPEEYQKALDAYNRATK